MRDSRNAPIRLHDLITDPVTDPATDLAIDPAQQHDLTEEQPDVVSDLIERMNSIRDRSK